jgi:hypothetical protein
VPPLDCISVRIADNSDGARLSSIGCFGASFPEWAEACQVKDSHRRRARSTLAAPHPNKRS